MMMSWTGLSPGRCPLQRGFGGISPLQVSAGHLRLYAVDALRTADRTTLRKVPMDATAAFAAPFSSARGPGLACVSADGALSVRALLAA